MTPNELSQELESGRFRQVYYLYGPEDYRIKEAEKYLVKRFLPKPLVATNHFTLTITRGNLRDVLTSLSVYPMLGEKQVFTIDEIQSLVPADIEKIFKLLTPSDPNRIVIFVTPASKLPRKDNKTFAFLKGNTAAVEFDRIPEQQAERRILTLLKDSRITIEPEALKILVLLCGGDMGGLTEEVNKLINYVGEGNVIHREDVARVGSDYQVFNIFELAGATATGNLDRALEIINFLMLQGEKGSGLLFWMSEHFINLYLAKNRKGGSDRKQRGYWAVKDQVHLFDNEQLQKIITLIAEADFDLRNNIHPERLILENLVLNISSLRSPRPR
jgi:DNA polymerase III subunit delta